jgi:fructose-specific phosphotransferase system IIA component
MNNIINKQLISLELEGSSKEDVIRGLSHLIDQEGRLENLEEYIQEVLHREGLSTTGVGFGIAIPHGKCKAVKHPAIALGRLKNAIDWASLDGSAVHTIFLLAVPEDAASNIHLKILASLSRKLMNEEFREQLFTTTCKESLMELLENLCTNCVA